MAVQLAAELAVTMANKTASLLGVKMVERLASM